MLLADRTLELFYGFVLVSWRTLFLVRMASLLTALLFMLLLLSPFGNTHLWLYAATALLFAQEIAGRMLFYGSYFRIGV